MTTWPNCYTVSIPIITCQKWLPRQPPEQSRKCIKWKFLTKIGNIQILQQFQFKTSQISTSIRPKLNFLKETGTQADLWTSNNGCQWSTIATNLTVSLTNSWQNHETPCWTDRLVIVEGHLRWLPASAGTPFSTQSTGVFQSQALSDNNPTTHKSKWRKQTHTRTYSSKQNNYTCIAPVSRNIGWL